MVIVVDEKLPPPPPYSQAPTPTPRLVAGGSNHRRSLDVATFSDLPPHIMLHVVYSTFPPTPSTQHGRPTPTPAELVQHRQILYWIQMCFRLVNRSTYVACMNVLRSVYLQSYQNFVRPGYSSDPFPLATPPGDVKQDGKTRETPLGTLQRETVVLDMFIAAKVREDVWLDETELHLEREETFKDLFDLNQPRARIEDLVRHYGTLSGSIYTAPSSSLSSPSTPTTPNGISARGSIPFHSLSISFSPRTVGIVIFSGGRKRTLVSIQRLPSESLEIVARRLVKELDKLRAGGGDSKSYGG